MESFVPFGGSLPMSSNSATPLSRQYDSSFPCQLCTDEYEQELAALLKEFSAPVGAEYQVNLLTFQQQTGPISINSGLDIEKAKDDGTTLSAKIMKLQKKWNDICQSQHRGSPILEKNMSSMGSETFTHGDGFHHDSDKEKSSDWADRNTGPQGQNTRDNMFAVADLHKISAASQSTGMPVISEVKGDNLLSNPLCIPSKSEQFQPSGFQSHLRGLSLLGMPDGRTSPSSETSVSTDLMLGIAHTSIGKTETSVVCPHVETSRDVLGCIGSTVADVTEENVSAAQTQYSSFVACSNSPGAKPVQTPPRPDITNGGASGSDQPKLCSSNVFQPFDIQDLKTFYRSLTEKVGWQEDAIHAISECIVRCRADNRRFHGARLRGDVWLCFLGPDGVGKRKIAMALAELLFGSRENLISADLNSQDGVMHSNTICNNKGNNGYKLSLRGKTVLDHIAGEICKKPCSVILLENVDKADLLVQTSLSQAIKTGRFSDSHGREFGISNAVFVTTAWTVRGKLDFSSSSHVKYPEESILTAQPWKMKIVVVPASDCVDNELCMHVSGTLKRVQSENVIAHKRKLSIHDDGDEQYQSMGTVKRTNKNPSTCFDLNLPVEEMGASDSGYCNDEKNCMSDDVEAAWMEEFLNAVDGTVIFKPFDFDALANVILTEISKSFWTAVGSQYMLEIDPKCMEQILAATWVAEDKEAIHNWMQQVLVRSLIEAREVCNLRPHSVLRLAACDDAPVEDYAPGIQLPLRISLN